MRYFLAAWAFLVIVFVSLMGFRGGVSRKPPIEVFPDMDRQMKLRPQAPAEFFGDNRSSRLPVAGTIARAEPLENVAGVVAQGAAVFPFEDNPVNTGRALGSTNYVEVSPMLVSAESMSRGRHHYQISCQPCHGALGDGNGVTKKLGMAVVANLHDPRIAKMTDGELFAVISHGRNLMAGYSAQISVADRWAVVSYVRALQLSRLGTLDDIPSEYRASLTK